MPVCPPGPCNNDLSPSLEILVVLEENQDIHVPRVKLQLPHWQPSNTATSCRSLVYSYKLIPESGQCVCTDIGPSMLATGRGTHNTPTPTMTCPLSPTYLQLSPLHHATTLLKGHPRPQQNPRFPCQWESMYACMGMFEYASPSYQYHTSGSNYHQHHTNKPKPRTSYQKKT